MMAEMGIRFAGAYVPASRLQRTAIAEAHAWANQNLKALAKGTRSYCNWDEDSVTMAVEAAQVCRAGLPSTGLDRLCFASTSAPFEDRANTALIVDALNLGEGLSTSESGGSLRAGTSALMQALESSGRTSLVIAADQRPTKPASPQEIKYGDGAAALVVGGDSLIARYLGGSSLSVDFVDHYRTDLSQTDYVVEERWLRDEGLAKILPRVIAATLTAAGVAAGEIDIVVAPLAPAMLTKVLAQLGLKGALLADNLFTDTGDTGAAHPLLMLTHALSTAVPGQKILLLGVGQGADGLVFETTGAVTAFAESRLPIPSRVDANYLRFLSFTGQLKLDWGIRAERDNRTSLTTFYRKRHMVTGFVGGKCSACDMPQFPLSRVCVNCGAVDAQQDYSFAGSIGQVKTFTEDWQAYTPSPPLTYGNVSFVEGGNLFMELTDCPPGTVAVGMRVRMVFRIKDMDDRRGFRRYFWKAVVAGGVI